MKKYWSIVLVLVVVIALGQPLITFASQKSHIKNETEWIIIPGERVGSITANTTRKTLVKLFGEQNLQDSIVDYGDSSYIGTMVFPQYPEKSIQIAWRDVDEPSPDELEGKKEIKSPTNKKPALLIISNPELKSLWHFSSGITLGTDLKQMELFNKKPFVISCWECCFSGIVEDNDWQNGEMKKFFSGTIAIGFENPLNKMPEEVAEKIRAIPDELTYSNSKTLQQRNPKINSIYILF